MEPAMAKVESKNKINAKSEITAKTTKSKKKTKAKAKAQPIRRTTIDRKAVKNWLSKFLEWARKPEQKSNFVVTIVGVLVAFVLASFARGCVLDRSTKQSLHLVYLEAQYNIGNTKEFLRDYRKRSDHSEAEFTKINVKRLQSIAAVGVSQDENLVRFLPHYKLSLLMAYLETVTALNQALQSHQAVLESKGFQPSPQEKDVREKVRDLGLVM
jgi:hypothetical protein